MTFLAPVARTVSTSFWKPLTSYGMPGQALPPSRQHSQPWAVEDSERSG